MTMKKQNQTAVRKPAKKITHPRVVRSLDAATHDAGAIRFGVGCCPASLRK